MDNEEYTIDISTLSGTTSTITVNAAAGGDLFYDTGSSSLNVYTSLGEWDTIDISNIVITDPVEFEDEMPSVAKVEDMCKDYPALEKAYENFKTIYKLVHQDWQGRQDDDQLHY